MQHRPPVGLNVHVYPSPFEYESRILKITQSLVSHSVVERILVIATAKEGLPRQQVLNDRREVLRIETRIKGNRLFPKILQFLEWSTRVFFSLRRESLEMLNCHSLSVLPLCVVLKWWHKSLLIYEPHELETETVSSKGTRKRIAKWVEGSIIGHADQIIVVSNSISESYRRDYKLANVPVILNVPEIQEHHTPTPNKYLRDYFDIPDKHLVFMYQGVLNIGRGIRLLLDAFSQVPLDRHLVFLGFGPLIDEIKAETVLRPNIHFHVAVSPDKIMGLTRGADVGLCMLTDDCLSYRYSLANKVFQYLHAEIPVFASSILVDTGKLLERYNCGWRVSNESGEIADCVTSIDLEAIEIRRSGTLLIREKFQWKHEEEKLSLIYRNLLASMGLNDFEFEK